MTTISTQTSSGGNPFAAIAAALGLTDATNHIQPDDKEKRLEQVIVNEVQNIIAHNKDYSAALAQVKKFLGDMQNTASTWGAEVQHWIQGELDKINSYKGPSQELLDQLSKDAKDLDKVNSYVQKAQDQLNADENTLSNLQAKEEQELHNLETQKDHYEKQIDSAPWYDKIVYGLAIAGLAIAIAAVKAGYGIATGALQAAVACDKDTLSREQNTLTNCENKIKDDNAAIKNDLAILATLSKVSGQADITNSKLDQDITKDDASKKAATELSKVIAEIKIGMANAV